MSTSIAIAQDWNQVFLQELDKQVPEELKTFHQLASNGHPVKEHEGHPVMLFFDYFQVEDMSNLGEAVIRLAQRCAGFLSAYLRGVQYLGHKRSVIYDYGKMNVLHIAPDSPSPAGGVSYTLKIATW